MPDEGQDEQPNIKVRRSPNFSPTCRVTYTQVLSNEPIIARSSQADSKKENKRKGKARPPKSKVVVLHCDVIKDEFWEERSRLLVES